MTEVDRYMVEVRSAMAGMEPSVREDILRELRSHIAEAAAANGGDTAGAVQAMGPPEAVGREYRKLYGYGRVFELLFALLAAGLAALSIPVLQGMTDSSGVAAYMPSLLSFPFLVAAIVWLLWVSVAAGSRAGLYAGIAAFAGRTGAALVTSVASAGILTKEGLAVLVVSSALLAVVGWLPGTAKKVWSRPRAEL